ncbi:MAG: hypothetical protein LBF15_01820 [Candidatus Peribacteria bacterium]|jgi:hypothetical protein|nr:hypothetical protein [Candidatus Peribacteria bacterium]
MKKDTSNKKALIVIIIISFIFALFMEAYWIYIDKYNFKEFEKAKVVLDTLPVGSEKFTNLKEFNEVYNMNITPIKNCYVMSAYNGDYPYIFAFKFESLFYTLKYQSWYFVYPKYDWGYFHICAMGGGVMMEVLTILNI